MKSLLVVIGGKCTGCKACEVACSLGKEGMIIPEKARIRIVRTEEDGLIMTTPVVCQQCEIPCCANACPVDAIYKDPNTGIKVVNSNKCIGCRTCVLSCPWGAITVDPDSGIAAKCDQCSGDPKCVKRCPSSALYYVDAEKVRIMKSRGSIYKYTEAIKDFSYLVSNQ